MRIPSMSFRRFRGDLIEIYKYTHVFYNCPSPFVINSENRTRGHNFKITKQPCNTSLRQKFFTIKAVDSWNNLNKKIVNAKSLDSFINLIDKEFKDLMYETNVYVPPSIVQHGIVILFYIFQLFVTFVMRFEL